MHKVGRLTDTHQGRARVYILHPGIHLLVCPESEIPQLVLGFDLQAERLQVDPLYILDLLQVTYLLRRRCGLPISL